MNVYDCASYGGHAGARGLSSRPRAPDDADLVILNTCHIREKAAEKVYSELGRLRVLKAGRARAGPRVSRSRSPAASRRPRARRSSAARRRSISWSARRAITACRDLLARAASAASVVDTEFPVEDKFDHLRAAEPRSDARARRLRLRHRAGRLRQVLHLLRRALYARRGSLAPGRARSSPRRERLADAGVREITLIGQNVNAYHGDGAGRPRLDARRSCCIALAEIPGIARLRYTTSHPRDMDDDLIAAHRDLPALMPHLHLPVQSGSDRILDAMNRRHTRADYLAADRAAARRAARHRASRPISSSAFPARPTRISRDTLALIEEVGFAGAYLVQVFAAPRHARRRHGRAGAGSREDRAAAALAGRDRPPAATRSTPAAVGQTLRRAVREARPPSRPDRRPLALSAAGARHGAASADRRDRAGDDHGHRHATACSATASQPARDSRAQHSQLAGA